MAIVITARLGGHPYFVQRLLKVDDNLTSGRKGEGDHASRALIVDVRVPLFVDQVAIALDRKQELLCDVHEFKIGHYNLHMLKVPQILVRLIVLAGSAAALAGCGQRGPLYLPDAPEARQRATLPETLNPAPAAAKEKPLNQ